MVLDLVSKVNSLYYCFNGVIKKTVFAEIKLILLYIFIHFIFFIGQDLP
jgi:hypothetical protein